MNKFTLIIIIILGLGIGAFYISSHPTAIISQIDTSDWKTYTYTKYGFSVKYPSDWGTSIGRSDELFINFGTGLEQRQLQVSVSGENKTLDEIIKTWEEDRHSKIPYSNTMVGGEEAIAVENEGTWLITNGKLYQFYLTSEDDPILLKMLDTVQFEEETATTTPPVIPPKPLTSGFTGSVLLGPVCPVERIPPDPNCADRPFETKLAITTADQSHIIKEFSSDADGNFTVNIEPGEYAIRSVDGAHMMPYCSSDVFKVTADSYTEIIVQCDTGIR